MRSITGIPDSVPIYLMTLQGPVPGIEGLHILRRRCADEYDAETGTHPLGLRHEFEAPSHGKDPGYRRIEPDPNPLRPIRVQEVIALMVFLEEEE